MISYSAVLHGIQLQNPTILAGTAMPYFLTELYPRTQNALTYADLARIARSARNCRLYQHIDILYALIVKICWQQLLHPLPLRCKYE